MSDPIRFGMATSKGNANNMNWEQFIGTTTQGTLSTTLSRRRQGVLYFYSPLQALHEHKTGRAALSHIEKLVRTLSRRLCTTTNTNAPWQPASRTFRHRGRRHRLRIIMLRCTLPACPHV